jgi:hypothetical protein
MTMLVAARFLAAAFLAAAIAAKIQAQHPVQELKAEALAT